MSTIIFSSGAKGCTGKSLAVRFGSAGGERRHNDRSAREQQTQG